jgi:hypothetical protein
MSDLRFCTICSLEIDIEEPGTKVFGGRNGKRLTVIDPQGHAHIVTTRYQSERKRNQTVVHATSVAKEK